MSTSQSNSSKSASNTTSSHSSNTVTVRNANAPNVADCIDSNSSISSINSNEEALLEQCIQAGIGASQGKPGRALEAKSKKNDDSSSEDDLDDDDEALLEQCIQAGISGVNVVAAKANTMTSKSQVTELNIILKVFTILKLSQNLQASGSGQTKITASNKARNESGLKKENLNDSLSSIDSVDEDLLEQCIEAGIQAKNPVVKNTVTAAKRSQLNTTKLSTVPEQNRMKMSRNDLSSDEDDTNPDDEALLEQCIQAGIYGTTKSPAKPQVNRHSILISEVFFNHNFELQVQVKKSGKENPIEAQNTSPVKRSQLPTFKPTSNPASNHRSRSTKRDHDDVQMLKDSLNKGTDRNNCVKATLTENKMQNLPLNHVDSKNAQTTSAVVSRTVGATDVVMTKQNGTDICAPDQHRTADMAAQIMNSKNESNTLQDDTIEIKVSAAPIETGFNNSSALTTSIVSIKSQNSFMSGEIPLLERSNEYPAFLGQNESITDSQHSSSIDMEVSNECLFESLSPSRNGKYKDPNLMLQSVDRFTHELVSTAEYLRTANGANDDDDVTITENKSSNNTWNEDTNPNAVSFPSISMTAPLIASMHDDDDVTISETKSKYEMANSEFIEDSTPTNEQKSNGISFEIGGRIDARHFMDGNHNCNGFNSHDTNSTMTNSTIIAMEADKIRTLIMNDQNRTDSMISLDKIRPPSVMEKMNNSSYCESLNGPGSLKGSPARFLAQGFMARRALQNNCNNSAHGSTDSINSSCNLDRVKPPSIMDDLLDSMISVDSIASEYVDNPIPHQIEEPSHYETAFSECDDMTTTLKSCADLPFDSTPCGSDFSSVESTPKKGRRSLTPRRKRQMTKDRYQTYTIATGESELALQSLENQNGNSGFFQMQLSNHPLLINDNDSDAISLVSTDDGEMSSIRAFTRNLPYLNNVEVHQDFSINTNTYTKHNRPSLQRNPQPSGDFAESIPIVSRTNSNASSRTASPNHTITKSPRIMKPTTVTTTTTTNGVSFDNNDNTEPKGIRGRKKPAYVSPYAMSKLTKTAPAPPKPITRNVTPKVELPKIPTTPKPMEKKAKSFIQRSAESLKKIKPAITSKLTRQNSAKKLASKNDKAALDSQKSNESAKSPETLIRQSTFIKDEPSEGQIPVIVSEPTSPKKTLVSRIPFNRTTSLQASRNVTKCKTNIEIPLQKSASSTFARRTMKAASSTSQISSPTTSKLSLSPRPSIESPSTSRSIFKKWSPSAKNISSPLQTNASKIPAVKTPAPIANTATKKITGPFRSATISPSKPSKIIPSRTISTNGRTTKV